MLFAILAIGGFLAALIFWAWCLQDFIEFIVSHWKSWGRIKKLLLSALFLFVLSLALQVLASFNKYFQYF